MSTKQPTKHRTEIIVAVIGVMAVVVAALVGNWDQIVGPAKGSPEPTPSPHAADPVPGKVPPPDEPPLKPPDKGPAVHALLHKKRYEISTAAVTPPAYCDFNRPEQIAVETTATHFYFKPFDWTAKARISVIPSNKARCAPGSAGKLPWDLAADKFISASFYTAYQGVDMPGITSEGKPCTFNLTIKGGALYVSLAVYQ